MPLACVDAKGQRYILKPILPALANRHGTKPPSRGSLLARLVVLVLVDLELVRRLEDVRIIAGPKDLAVAAHPLGVVDAVNVVLDLHDDAAVLGDDAGEVLVVLEALRLLDGDAAVHAVAAVDLKGLLVGKDVNGDAGPLGAQAGDGALGAPVIRAEVVAVDEEAIVCSRKTVLAGRRLSTVCSAAKYSP